MKNIVIALDMGGTVVKYGLVTEENKILFSEGMPASSADDKERILNRLSQAIIYTKKQAENIGADIIGVGISTPGPFDYTAAKSHMVGKYDAIYDIDLRSELRARSVLPVNIPLIFMQDTAAYLLGESICGAGHGYHNIACITLGTGCGYACMLNGKLLLNERGGPRRVFAVQKYRETDKTMEELVSGRAIEKNYGIDAKTLATMAHSGDAFAIKAFNEVGRILGDGLCCVREMRFIDCFILGGQVACSFDLLEGGLREGLKELRRSIVIIRAAKPDYAALAGVASVCFGNDDLA